MTQPNADKRVVSLVVLGPWSGYRAPWLGYRGPIQAFGFRVATMLAVTPLSVRILARVRLPYLFSFSVAPVGVLSAEVS